MQEDRSPLSPQGAHQGLLEIPADLVKYTDVLNPAYLTADPTKQKICENCGMVFSKKGFGKHANSLACNANRHILLVNYKTLRRGSLDDLELELQETREQLELQAPEPELPRIRHTSTRLADGADEDAVDKALNESRPAAPKAVAPKPRAKAAAASLTPSLEPVDIQVVERSKTVKKKANAPEASAILEFIPSDDGTFSWNIFCALIQSQPDLDGLVISSAYTLVNTYAVPILSQGQNGDETLTTAMHRLIKSTKNGKPPIIYLEPRTAGGADSHQATGAAPSKLKPASMNTASKSTADEMRFGRLPGDGSSGGRSIDLADPLAGGEAAYNRLKELYSPDADSSEICDDHPGNYPVWWKDVKGWVHAPETHRRYIGLDAFKKHEYHDDLSEDSYDLERLLEIFMEILKNHPALRPENMWQAAKQWAFMVVEGKRPGVEYTTTAAPREVTAAIAAARTEQSKRVQKRKQPINFGTGTNSPAVPSAGPSTASAATSAESPTSQLLGMYKVMMVQKMAQQMSAVPGLPAAPPAAMPAAMPAAPALPLQNTTPDLPPATMFISTACRGYLGIREGNHTWVNLEVGTEVVVLDYMDGNNGKRQAKVCKLTDMVKMWVDASSLAEGVGEDAEGSTPPLPPSSV